MTISASTPIRVMVLLTSIALALLLLLTGSVVARATDGSSVEGVTPQVEYRVRAGDTLWEIAGDHTDPGDDVRNTISDIKTASGLESSVIVVGQVLVIPLDS